MAAAEIDSLQQVRDALRRALGGNQALFSLVNARVDSALPNALQLRLVDTNDPYHPTLVRPDMKSTKAIILTFACLAAAACATAQPKDAGIETGFVASSAGKAFLYTTDGHLLPTRTIQLQYPAEKGGVACCLRLQGSELDAPSKSTEPVSDALLGRPLFRYRLKQLPAALTGDPFVAAAVIGASSVKAEATSAGMTMQIEGATAASASTVQVCLGSEGSNLFLIADGKLKTQMYYSFGYDVTATCDPKLFELPTAP